MNSKCDGNQPLGLDYSYHCYECQRVQGARATEGAEKAPERPTSLHTIRMYKGLYDTGRDEPMLVASIAYAYMDALESRIAELEHHFDTLSFELSECTGIIAQQDVQIHWLKIPDMAKRVFELEEELARYTAKWWTDSSLETWFPLTAEEMERLKAIRHPEDKPDVDTPILVAHKTRKCWIICTWSGENWYEHQSYDLIFSGNVVGWKELPTLPRMETGE